MSLENLASNLKFSWPTYKSGLRVMIHAKLQTGSTWAFSEVFHWSVWLALGLTAVAVGLLVAFIEWITPNQYGESKKGGLYCCCFDAARAEGDGVDCLLML